MLGTAQSTRTFYLISLTNQHELPFLFCDQTAQGDTASSVVKWDALPLPMTEKKGESMTYSSDSVAVQDLGEKKEEIFFKYILSVTKFRSKSGSRLTFY